MNFHPVFLTMLHLTIPVRFQFLGQAGNSNPCFHRKDAEAQSILFSAS
jgi:hypothetical protein